MPKECACNGDCGTSFPPSREGRACPVCGNGIIVCRMVDKEDGDDARDADGSLDGN